MATTYPFRKKTTYQGIKIDIKAWTEEELGVKYNKRITEIENGIVTMGGSTLMSSWVNKFFKMYVDDKVSTGVAEDRRALYKNHIKQYIGSMKIRDIKNSHCQIIINEMQGYSKDRIDKTCQLLFNIFKKAKSEHLIAVNPADDLIRPPAEDGERRPVTLQERSLMLMVAQNHKAGLWIQTMLCCGFRPGETDRLKASHINYEEELIYIDGTKSNAAKRIVPAPTTLLKKMEKLNRKNDEYIFQNSYGGKMQKSSRAKLWNSFKKEMDIRCGCKIEDGEIKNSIIATDLVPYCCRHSFATDLKDAKIPYRIRQELLGHANNSVTDKYTHRTETSLKIAKSLLKTFRDTQNIEIKKMQHQILENGYLMTENNAEDLMGKYFPNLK